MIIRLYRFFYLAPSYKTKYYTIRYTPDCRLKNLTYKIAISFIFTIILLNCSTTQETISPLEPCTVPWYQALETQFNTGDSEGHGPDLGSGEWKSVIEFKLGIHKDPTVPEQNSKAWCTYIDVLIRDTF